MPNDMQEQISSLKAEISAQIAAADSINALE
jgi:hypothetical protein